MKKNIYVSPVLTEQRVVTEAGFTVSNPAGGGFNDYIEEDFNC